MDSFVGIGLGDGILKAIKELGFETPTPIQAKAIPHLLESKQHLIGSAQTGTGKTGAFGLPSVQLADTSKKHTQTIILSPTRELCLQITKDLQNYAKYVDGLTILAVYGGSNIDAQIRTLRKGAQIVVATPGRAVDLIKRKKLLLGEIDRLILDEADEMLTMGFKDDLDFIIDQAHEERQIILFSATMSKRIKTITKSYMSDAIEIAAAKVNMGASTVEHLYYTVSAREKYEVLKRVADMNPDIYGIVFCRTRRETKEVANKLMGDGYNADALHGDLSQAQRDEVMNRFRVRHLQMLVATDVASRGLDVDDLTHVINYNLPDDIEAYVHRSGRTGRAGKSGISIAIVNSREKKRIREIERTSKITFAHTPVPTGKEICSRQLYSLIDKLEKVEVDEKEIEPFLPEILEKLKDLDREQIIKHFVYSEFNRFLDYYKDAPDLNRKGERSSGDRSSGKRERKGGNAKFARIFVNLGQKQYITPPRLIGVINEALDSSEAEIGKIDIMKNFSFFDIDEEFAKAVIKGVKKVKYDGQEVNMEISTKPAARRDRFDRKGRNFKKKKRNTKRY